jgi:hypothetical protein
MPPTPGALLMPGLSFRLDRQTPASIKDRSGRQPCLACLAAGTAMWAIAFSGSATQMPSASPRRRRVCILMIASRRFGSGLRYDLG